MMKYILNILKTKKSIKCTCAKGFISTTFLLILLIVTTFASSLMIITLNNLESLDHLKKIKLDTIKERLILDTFTCNLLNDKVEDFEIADLYVEVYESAGGYRLLSGDIDLEVYVENNRIVDYTH